MSTGSALNLLWKVAVLSLLIFCAYRLQSLETNMRTAAAPPGHSMKGVTPEQVAKEQRELHDHLNATKHLVGNEQANSKSGS